MPLPPLTVAFKNKLASEEVEELKSMGASVIPHKDEDQIKYTFGSQDVTLDLLQRLSKHKKIVRTQNACPMGSINIATMQSLFKVLGIFTWFLKTHVYPAFTKEVDTIEFSSAFDTIEGFMTLKRKTKTGYVGPKKKVKLDDNGMDIGDDDDDDTYWDDMQEALFGQAESKVPKAKPSTIPANISGSFSAMPTLPGLVFPYFEGMISNDTAFVASIIRTYFLECLGGDREAVIGGYKDVKLHMGLIAGTLTGRILQHMFLGVKLAIEGQARLFPIFNGSRYVGFTLHGWYFTVSLDGYVHSPVTYDKLVQEVKSIDEHNVALSKILDRLSKLKMISTGKLIGKATLMTEKAGCTNPRYLATLIRKFKLDDGEKEEIEKLATSLSFPQRFWTIDNKTIIKAIDLLLSGSFPPLDAPMYTRGGTYTTDDPKLSTFAMFGDQAFSLRLTGGESRLVPKDIASDVLFKTYRGKNGKETTPKPVFVIAKKTHSLCLEDWAAFLIDHKVLSKSSRDAIFKCAVLGGDKAKDFWYELIKRIGPLEIDSVREVNADTVELGDEYACDNVDSFADFL